MYKIENSSISGGVPNSVFMQDNSPIHSLYYCALTWFQEAGWEVADHLACSPNLNPIEYVRRYLKMVFHKVPQLCLPSGGQVAVKKRIAEYLEEVVWLTRKKYGKRFLHTSLLNSLTRSMPRRIAAVIKAEGRYSKYQ